MVDVLYLHRYARQLVGFIPSFLDRFDPRPAREQLDANYVHGGGWKPMRRWSFDPASHAISYPGDPPLKPVAIIRMRDERIYISESAWVCIVQPDGAFEVARMD